MGRRSKIVEQCTELMDDPEHIRNIGIVAHVDHGKCVSAESRIALSDGQQIPAKELYNKIKSSGEPVENEEDTYLAGDDFQVASLDVGKGKTVEGNLLYGCRREAEDDLLRIKTSNGHTLETTPEHKYLVLTSGGVMDYKRASNLDEGDVVVGSRKLPNNKRLDMKTEFLRELSGDYGFYVNVSERFNSIIEDSLRKDLYEMSDSKLKYESFKHSVWRGQYRLRDLVCICDELDISHSRLYDAIETLNYRGEESRGVHSSLEIELPEDLSPLFYIAGVFFGDGGTEGNITNNSTKIKQVLRDKAGELGLDTIVREFEDRGDRIEIGGVTLLKLLQNAFNYPREDKASSIRIPNFVFGAKHGHIEEFIRGYLDADGCVEPNRSAVSISSSSLGMLRDLQVLLYQFDIASKLNHENSTLYISGELSLKNFENIGFKHPEKQERYETLLSKASSAKVDAVPVSGEKLKEIRTDVGASLNDVGKAYSSYENNHVSLTKNSLGKIADRLGELDEEDQAIHRINRMKSLSRADTSFVRVESIERKEADYVYDFGVEDHRNFICEGIVVHNTTLTDNLLAGAGMISEELSGQQLFMDTAEDEQERGITIDAANVSMVHDYEGDNFLINLIDTPGHVDFGGDVTRAMRAVDGAVVVVDAVEGAMPQTETVLRQALREEVKPVLFINKVDRLINELQEGPQELQDRLTDVIAEVNNLIRQVSSEKYDEGWKVKVEDGSVAFGSALYNWAISAPYMQKSGIDFADVYDYNKEGEEGVKELAQASPLFRVVLNMVVNHFPDPVEAQRRRIPTIWRGDPDSEVAEDMSVANPDGDVVFMVTDISMDPHAGEVATGRLFSGTLERGQELYVSGVAGKNRLQNVGIFMGDEREEVDGVPAGNIAAVTGLRDAIAGSTVSSVEMTAFESIEHISEPVVTVAVEAKEMDDLPKLIEVLQQISKEDPTVHVEIDEETGEHLISGMGELHLEVITQRIERNRGIPVTTSEPIVVYRESVSSASDTVEGVSPNRHNRFYIEVEPLPDEVVEALKLGEASMDQPEEQRREVLMEAGLDKELAQNVQHMYTTNLLVDMTKGIQHLRETMELIEEGFDEAIQEGPLAGEPGEGVMVKLMDVKLHEDAIHRGPAQVIPAVRQAIHRAMIDSEVRLLEPIQDIYIETPQDHMGEASAELQGRRGHIEDMEHEGELVEITGQAPVAELFGFSSDIRSATEGKATWNAENAGFQPLPDNLQEEIVMDIRERKGMKQELPEGIDYF